MQINNIKTNNKGFYYYQTDEYYTINIAHYFSYENTKENYLKASILANYLSRTNKKYSDQKSINNKADELYGLKFDIANKSVGIKNFLKFSLQIPNPRIIKEDYFNEAIEFYKDIMLNPNFINNKLDEKVFKEIKNDLIEQEKEFINNQLINQIRLFEKSIMPKSSLNNRNFTDIEEVINIINSITDTDIINFYNQVMNNFVCSFAIGNLLKEEINLIEESFDFKPINFDYKYSQKELITSKDIEIVSKDITQSYIYFVYDIKNYNIKNKYLYYLLKIMFTSFNGPILNTFRTKLGIAYGAYGEIYINSGVFIIEVDIDKNNKEKAQEGEKEILLALQDKQELSRLINQSKEYWKRVLLYSDSINDIIAELENYCLKIEESNEKKYEAIDSVTIDDILYFFQNIERKCTYFYKGDKNGQ